MVGLVRGLHGLDGTVRVEPLSDDPGRFQPGSRLHPEGAAAKLTIDYAQADGPGLLVHFAEVRSREGAEPLRDTYLEADVTGAAPAPDAFWWHEVIGVPVSTETGERLGEVVDVFRAGGSEVYVVGGGPRGEVLIPAVRAVFRDFAPREGRLVVDAAALGLDEVRPRRPRGRRSSRAAPRAQTTPGSGDGSGQAPGVRGGSAGEAPDAEGGFAGEP